MLSEFVQCALEQSLYKEALCQMHGKKYGTQQVGPSGPFVDKRRAVEFWEKISNVLGWNGGDCGVT